MENRLNLFNIIANYIVINYIPFVFYLIKLIIKFGMVMEILLQNTSIKSIFIQFNFFKNISHSKILSYESIKFSKSF